MTRPALSLLALDIAEGLLMFVGAMFFAAIVDWVAFCIWIGG
jgi:hypothetical protein